MCDHFVAPERCTVHGALGSRPCGDYAIRPDILRFASVNGKADHEHGNGQGNGAVTVKLPWGSISARGQQVVAILVVLVLGLVLLGGGWLLYRSSVASASEHAQLDDSLHALIYTLLLPPEQRSEALRSMEKPRLFRHMGRSD